MVKKMSHVGKPVASLKRYPSDPRFASWRAEKVYDIHITAGADMNDVVSRTKKFLRELEQEIAYTGRSYAPFVVVDLDKMEIVYDSDTDTGGPG